MKEEWIKQRQNLGREGLQFIWFYNYYIEHPNKSNRLNFSEFQNYFQQFLQMLNINIAFQEGQDLKTLFADGNSYYISTNGIINKVINYFDNKTNWNEN